MEKKPAVNSDPWDRVSPLLTIRVPAGHTGLTDAVSVKGGLVWIPVCAGERLQRPLPGLPPLITVKVAGLRTRKSYRTEST